MVVEPPPGWLLHGAHGFMRLDTSPSGRLALLADVTAWLMESRELPSRDAVAIVCDALGSADAASCLYLVSENSNATPVTASTDFGYHPIRTSFWDSFHDGRDAGNARMGVGGAIAVMRENWGESATPGRVDSAWATSVAPLSIRLDKAFELWGYGQLPAGASMPAATDEWPGQRLAQRRDELKGRGVRAFMAQVAEESGMHVRAVSRAIAIYEKSAAHPSWTMPSRIHKVGK